MRVLSPGEWAEVKAEREPLEGESLGAYSIRLQPIRKRHDQQYPGVDFSNGRYEVHLENCLRAGLVIPWEYLDGLRTDHLDCHLLCRLRGIESMRDAIDRIRAMEDAP